MPDQNKKDHRKYWIPREAIVSQLEAQATAAKISAKIDAKIDAKIIDEIIDEIIAGKDAKKDDKTKAKIKAEIITEIEAKIAACHSDLTDYLGGGPKARLYLDAVTFWIECQLEENKIDKPTLAEQKIELSRIAKKAGELTSLLDSMSLDTAFTLRIALAKDSVPVAERDRMVFNPGYFSATEPPYFPDDDLVSTFMAQLELWSKLAGDQARSIKTSRGPRTKITRDLFVYRVVRQYHDTFGDWPPRGKTEDFHGVVKILCNLAGFKGEPEIEKVIKTAKEVFDAAKKATPRLTAFLFRNNS